jgi:hypothetical protein
MSEEEITYARAEKMLGLKDGSIAAHKAELKQMKEEMVAFVLTYTVPDLKEVDIELTEAAKDEAEQIVLGLLSIGVRYGIRKMFHGWEG